MTLEKLQSFTKENTYVCIDFDGTITAGTMEKRGRPVSSMSFVVSQPSVHQEFEADGIKLYQKYRPVEISNDIHPDEKFSHMFQWWSEVFALFEKFNVGEDIFQEAYRNIGSLKIRKGMKKSLLELIKKEIPIIVLSAGVHNIIEKFLEFHGLLAPNVFVIANKVSFEKNGFPIVPKNEKLIFASNKDSRHFSDEIFSTIEKRENIIVIGDNYHDYDMASHVLQKQNIFSIGFLNYPDDTSRKDFSSIYDEVIESHDSTLGRLEKILNFIT